MITVAQAVLEALTAQKVRVVFGYPGAAICPVYDRLLDFPIRHVLVRQEQNAVHAASGYARASGQTGVVFATSGPGATNLLTGLATAYMDSIPLVAITGQVSLDQIGKDVFQEADITGAAEPFTKYSYLCKDPRQIGRILKEAFYIAASGRPGPVLIDLPVDVQRAEIAFSYPDSVSIRGYKPTFAGNALQIKRVAEAIASARRPLVCIGGGVLSAGAGAETARLAERCGLPVVSTLMGLSAIPSSHPLYFGMLGAYGNETANFAVRGADLLVIIGARAGDRAMATPSFLEKRSRVVHIDVDPAEIGKNVGASIPLVGDAKSIVSQLLDCTGRPDCGEWVERLTRKREEAEALWAQRLSPPKPGFIHPLRFMRRLSERLASDAVVTADVGQNQIWAAHGLRLRQGRFLTSGGMGTMGYSLPAAIGAKLAAPGRQTVVVCGDGSLQMQQMELATLCQEGLDIKLAVLDNRSLGMVRELQRLQYGGRLSASALDGGPDFLKLAEAYALPGLRLTEEEQMEEAIRWLLEGSGPRLLCCAVDPDERSL
ncbi:MAG: biosynthetic-type acetolactate synthase large subunit [Provencibacterium sp.]|nr:biosynthetic-type acetolactate synthase large subunit [Provencibacterium sp.]